MSAVAVPITRAAAEARRREIHAQIGDVEAFRERAEKFTLDAEELVLFDDLRELEFLLGG